MKDVISKKISKYYNTLYTKHGFSPQSVGWGNKKGKQSIRFEILCQIGDFSNSTILDIGCGFGDFFKFLCYKKSNSTYYGVDINKEIIEAGKKIYPKISLECRDFEKNKFTKKFDWVVASGITSHGSTYLHLTSIMKEMFRLCKRGIAINFVSNNVDFKTMSLFYASPEKISVIAKSISNRFLIRHDYMPYEFTLYLYKNNKKTSNHIFKNFLEHSKIKLDDSKWHPYYKNMKSS